MKESKKGIKGLEFLSYPILLYFSTIRFFTILIIYYLNLLFKFITYTLLLIIYDLTEISLQRSASHKTSVDVSLRE